MISELVGLPVSNVSMYDASTAAAEALTCAVRIHDRKATQKSTVYVSELIPPHRMSVIENYTQGAEIVIHSSHIVTTACWTLRAQPVRRAVRSM